MKRRRTLKFFISSMLFLVLSFGLLNSSAFADCQTTIWGRQTLDWKQLWGSSYPASEICCYFNYTGPENYAGYYITTISGSFGSLNSNEIVVGAKTTQCEGSTHLWASREDCVDDPAKYCNYNGCVCHPSVPQAEFPTYRTEIDIYLDKLEMG